METKPIGQVVKEWREASGLSYVALARLVGHGVKYQNIQQLEKGVGNPTYVMHLAAAMGTTVEALYRGEVPPVLGASSRGSTPRKEPSGEVEAVRSALTPGSDDYLLVDRTAIDSSDATKRTILNALLSDVQAKRMSARAASIASRLDALSQDRRMRAYSLIDLTLQTFEAEEHAGSDSDSERSRSA